MIRMKQPDDPAIGGSRKSLPTRKVRKVGKAVKPAKSQRNKTNLEVDSELDLIKVFGER